jgi:putative endonuclease
MPYYTYILQSLKDYNYYIGSTSDVAARLIFHNEVLQRSTTNRTPFRLALFEEYGSKEDALKREKQIKSWKGGTPFKNLVAWK